jgi:hypothetical protein
MSSRIINFSSSLLLGAVSAGAGILLLENPKNKKTFSTLTRMIRDVLIISVAAVGPERVFSAGRAVVDWRRNRLAGSTIENILVFRAWYDKLQKKELKTWRDDQDDGGEVVVDADLEKERQKEKESEEAEEEEITMGLKINNQNYISEDEEEAADVDSNGDYNSADEMNQMHTEFIRRRNMGSNYNHYAKKPKPPRARTLKRKTPSTTPERTHSVVQYETEATKKRRQAQAEAKASARFGRPSRNKFKS